MVIFQHNDTKFLFLKSELLKIGIESEAVNGHPIFAPFFLVQELLRGKKVGIYVFRYINDSESTILAIGRYFSDLLQIFLCRIFRIKIWWLCHNVDRETAVFHPMITRLRRRNIIKYSERIFTTNSLLIPTAQHYFPEKFVDSLSLGFIEGVISERIERNDSIDREIVRWMESNNTSNTKFIFCIGSPADKSLHFQLINKFIENVNRIDTSRKWFAIVVGDRVRESPFIYNVPYRHFVNPEILLEYASYYYRVINDYSISYSVFEAVHYRIPIITESYGILPEIVKYYNIGIVIDSLDNLLSDIDSFQVNFVDFERFEALNNWQVAASKIKFYYQLDVR